MVNKLRRDSGGGGTPSWLDRSAFLIDHTGRKRILTTQDSCGYVENYGQIRSALLARVPPKTDLKLRTKPFEWLPPRVHRLANAIEPFTILPVLFVLWQYGLHAETYVAIALSLLPMLFTSQGVGRAWVQSGDHTLVPSA